MCQNLCFDIKNDINIIFILMILKRPFDKNILFYFYFILFFIFKLLKRLFPPPNHFLFINNGMNKILKCVTDNDNNLRNV